MGEIAPEKSPLPLLVTLIDGSVKASSEFESTSTSANLSRFCSDFVAGVPIEWPFCFRSPECATVCRLCVLLE